MVESLYKTPSFLRIASNGAQSTIVYISTKTGTPLLYLWNNGKSQLLTPEDESVTGLAALHDTQPWVVFGKNDNGPQQFSLCVCDYATQCITQITENIGRITGLFWCSDDEWVVTGCDTQYYVRVYSRDNVTPLFTTKEHIGAADYDSKRKVVAAAVGRGPGTTLGLIDFAGDITWISESDQSEDTNPCVYPEKGLIAYTTDVCGDTEIVVRSLETLQLITRSFSPGDVTTMVWVDETTLCAAIAKNAHTLLRFLTINGKWSNPVTTSVSNLCATKKGPLWINSTFSQPTRVQTLKNKKVVTLLGDNTDKYIPGESHWYTPFDGRKIQGWLLRTTNAKALVVYCHAHPFSALSNTWIPSIQALAQAGYHVFIPNFRGSATFGPEFKALIKGDLGCGDVKDILYGANYAKTLLKTKKPAIVGDNYGGYLVMQALITSHTWAGGVAVAPWVDLSELYKTADAHDKALLKYLLGGTPEEIPAVYKERSPITYIELLENPVLIIHIANDPRHPFQSIKALYEEAGTFDVPVDLEIIKGKLNIATAVTLSVLQLEYLKTLF
jgi:alpha/beta superfamily hydrolase